MSSASATRRITTHDASVKTAAVEVKALTISGKQVTLSVFRQLVNEPLINPHDGTLFGTPWGRVNYFWGDCEPDHLHVVWEKSRELRRACVYHSPIKARSPKADELYRELYALYGMRFVRAVCAGEITEVSAIRSASVILFGQEKPLYLSPSAAELISKYLDQLNSSPSMPQEISYEDFANECKLARDMGGSATTLYSNLLHEYLYRDLPESSWAASYESFVAKRSTVYESQFKAWERMLMQRLSDVNSLLSADITISTIDEEIEEVREKEHTLQHNWENSFGLIEATDQLFIAV